MRIVGGEARGRRIHTPNASSVRPTAERIKSAFFSKIQPVEGKSFLDLFAGTGNMGLEALSRGAARAIFVESDKLLAQAIQKNIASCCFTSRTLILPFDFIRAIGILSLRHWISDIVFADPPYDEGYVDGIMERAGIGRLMKSDSLLAIQHSRRETIREGGWGFELIDQRRYGDTILSFLRKAGP